MSAEPLTDDEWAAWLSTASADELRDQASTWQQTRTGQLAMEEIERREAGGEHA